MSHAWDTLYAIDKNGKTKIWSASAVMEAERAVAIVTFGLNGGKMQEARREYIAGKNLGKKNETSAWQQCVSETERKWRDKMEKEGYSTHQNDEEKEPDPLSHLSSLPILPILPMLAHTFDPVANSKKRHAITFPCYTQPKIDGLRCLMYYSEKHGDVVAQSRTGGTFSSVAHLTTCVRDALKHHPQWVLDGELYTRQYPFEELAGLLKKSKRSEEDTRKLLLVQYHLYDAFHRGDLSLSFQERWRWVSVLHSHVASEYLVLVETRVAHDLEDFRRAFSLYVADGWEGVMLRNSSGEYTPNYRSNDLVKYKEFLEEEFTIVGWKEGEGRDQGTVIWECRTEGGSTFAVRPRGTLEMRRAWFEEAVSWMGKRLTVIFQEWSEKRIPRFPVGKALREAY